MKRPTIIEPSYTSKAHYDRLLARHVHQVSELQRRLSAANQDALLVIFHDMDAAGKDGAIRHVTSGVNSQGMTCSRTVRKLTRGY